VRDLAKGDEQFLSILRLRDERPFSDERLYRSPDATPRQVFFSKTVKPEIDGNVYGTSEVVPCPNLLPRYPLPLLLRLFKLLNYKITQ
jgi:hypothetical protein